MIYSDLQLIDTCFGLLNLQGDLNQISLKIKGIIGDNTALGRASSAKASLATDIFDRMDMCSSYLENSEVNQIGIQTIGMFCSCQIKAPMLQKVLDEWGAKQPEGCAKADYMSILDLLTNVLVHVRAKMEKFKVECSYLNLFIGEDSELTPDLESAMDNLKGLSKALALSDVENIFEYSADVQIFLNTFIPALRELVPVKPVEETLKNENV